MIRYHSYCHRSSSPVIDTTPDQHFHGQVLDFPPRARYRFFVSAISLSSYRRWRRRRFLLHKFNEAATSKSPSPLLFRSQNKPPLQRRRKRTAKPNADVITFYNVHPRLALKHPFIKNGDFFLSSLILFLIFDETIFDFSFYYE